jgi:formylglycine-generating enzyme required for sulfatase activity
VNAILRDKSAIGGLAGLVLLAGAFAYRWFAPGTDDEALPTPDPGRVTVVEPAEPRTAAPPTPDDTPRPPEAAAASEPGEAADLHGPQDLSADMRTALADAMTRGDAALAAGRAGLPADDSAIYWYEAALEIDPGDAGAKRGLENAVQGAIAQANAALDAGDPKPASELIAALAEGGHAEGESKALAKRVDNLPQVEAALREGAQRMAAGQRFEPDGASALDSYRAAHALDAGNSAARQGLAEIERVVLTHALAAASDDRFEESDKLLALAGTIAPGSQAQLETRTRVVELQHQRASMMLKRASAALDGRDTDLAEQLIARAQELGATEDEAAPLRLQVRNARLYDHLAPGAVFRDSYVDRNGSAPEMVVMPIGEFTMGSPAREPGRRDNEGPPHSVNIARAFALGRTEVTVAQFRRFVRRTDFSTDAERLGSSTFYDEKTGRIVSGRGIDWRSDYTGENARDDEPVVHVSWNDARAYAEWLATATSKSYRLPSEAEFEYALRAGATTRYAWGNGEPTRVVANVTGDADRSRTKRSWTRAFARYDDGYWGPAPVGRYPASAFGLSDMGGNVSEWVVDCWHDGYLRAPEDGSAWVNKGCRKRVVRGASWASVPDQVRVAYRISSAPDVRGGRVGIRVARDL